AALVRAGVPLEPALAELGGDLPGRLGKIATMLADRTRSGQSLLEALGERSAQVPGVYRAVVEAGLRAGRLPAALEAMAGSIRRLAETRRGIAAAALYPLLVLMIAWGALAFFASTIAPRLSEFFEQFDLLGPATRGLFGLFVRCGHWAVYWGPAVPVAVVVLAGVWWFRSGRAAIAEPRRGDRLIGWLPWMGRMLRWSRTATFLEVLALLVDSDVPLHDAVTLAAGASGDPRMLAAAKDLAAMLERGQQPDRSQGHGKCLPPLLCWLIAAGRRHGTLLPALRHAADTYARRARHQAHLASVLLPIVFTLAIGGGITLFYALTLFAPYTSMLRGLGGP
ncbi:MAG: hypothetical protein A2V70_00835, partial [Planctomycetes bacterium RBG_13_63_9]